MTRFHEESVLMQLSPDIYQTYPSLLRMSLMPQCFEDPRCARHSLALAVAALKANGSRGIHVLLNKNHRYFIDFYSKLGFFEVPCPESEAKTSNTVIMGRIF